MIERLLNFYKANQAKITQTLAVAGTAASVVALIAPPHIAQILKYVILALFLLITAIIIRRGQVLSVPERSARYYVNIPPDVNDLNAAITLAKAEFGENTIPAAVVRHAFNGNQFGIVIARDAQGSVVGFLDYYGLNDNAMNDLIAGRFTESQFATDNILTLDEIKEKKKIYIGGILVIGDTDYDRGRVILALLRVGLRLIKSRIVAEVGEVEVYATAYGPKAVGIIKKLGFHLLQAGAERTDQSDLYCKVLNRKNINEVIRRIPVNRDGVSVRYLV